MGCKAHSGRCSSDDLLEFNTGQNRSGSLRENHVRCMLLFDAIRDFQIYRRGIQKADLAKVRRP